MCLKMWSVSIAAVIMLFTVQFGIRRKSDAIQDCAKVYNRLFKARKKENVVIK